MKIWVSWDVTLWHCVVWQKDTRVWEDLAAAMFCHEDGCSRFPRTISTIVEFWSCRIFKISNVRFQCVQFLGCLWKVSGWQSRRLFFYFEDGSSRYLCNIGTCLSTRLHGVTRRLYLSYALSDVCFLAVTWNTLFSQESCSSLRKLWEKLH
jgi:hypothetical protein